MVNSVDQEVLKDMEITMDLEAMKDMANPKILMELILEEIQTKYQQLQLISQDQSYLVVLLQHNHQDLLVKKLLKVETLCQFKRLSKILNKKKHKNVLKRCSKKREKTLQRQLTMRIDLK